MLDLDEIEGLLRQLEAEKTSAGILEQPGLFLKALHNAWCLNGGQLNGKPCHSVRQLQDLIGQSNKYVPSLTPKLSGRTRFKISDVNVILNTMLRSWTYRGPFGKLDRKFADYEEFPCDNLEKLVLYVVQTIFPAGSHEQRHGIYMSNTEQSERKAKAMAPTQHLQIEIGQRSFDRLQKLRENTEVARYDDVIADALRLYETVVDDVLAGSQVLVRINDGTEVPYRIKV